MGRLTFTIFFFLFFNGLVISNPSLQIKEHIPRIYKSSFQSGEEYLKAGDFNKAIKEFGKSLGLAEDYDYQEGKILCLMRLGLLHWNTGELEESSQFYRSALSTAEKYEFETYAKECLKLLDIYSFYLKGKEYRASGNYQESIGYFQQAVDLAKKIRSEAHELKCLRQMSICYLETSKIQMFFSLNEEALRLAIQLNYKKEKIRCLNNIGIYQKKIGNFSEALNCYQEALIDANNCGYNEEKSAILNNIGNIYKNMGNFSRSLQYLSQALEIDKSLDAGIDIVIDLINIGETYRARGLYSSNLTDYEKALSNFSDCLRFLENLRNKIKDINLLEMIRTRVLNNIGTTYLNLKKYGYALNFFKNGYFDALAINDLEALGMISCNLGIVHFIKEDYRKASTFYKEAIRIGEKTKASNILWEAYFGLGNCFEKFGELQKAVEYYQNSIEEIDNIRSRIYIDSFKAGFARDKLYVHETLIGHLYSLGKKGISRDNNEKIFSIMEKAKARAFLESIGNSHFNIMEKLSPEIKEREKELSNRISSILHSLSNYELNEREREEKNKDYDQAENEYMLLISRIRTEIPEVASMISPEPCHLDIIQNELLDNNSALIEYFLGEQKSYIFFISKKCIEIFLLPSRQQIQKSIKGYIKEISDPPRGKYRGILAGKRLYREFFSPVAKILPESVDHLIIVPDGVLYYLPFESLIVDSEDQSCTAQYLVEKYKISYAPSSSSLLFLKKNREKKQFPMALFAMGNPNYDLRKKPDTENGLPSKILKEIYENQGFEFSPLPYSEKEIKNISKFFPKNKQKIYLENQAKEEVIKNASLENYQIIHLACHSLLDERFPFRSALVLTVDKDSEEDGFLLVREINNLRLSAEMIVLSACQTGRGRLENIEGVLGLPRIFFYCGARSVVSCLWKINDKSTTKFMSFFYKYLSQGESKSQALRLAKLALLKSKYSHPFYWASFVLYGDEIPLHNIH